jgi:hypothetical protein
MIGASVLHNSTAVQPPSSVRTEIAALYVRLQRDYDDRFGQLGGGFDMWWNRTKIGVESLFPGRGRLGPAWGTTTRYAHLSWWPFGEWTQTKQISDAERDLRMEIEAFLARGVAPKLPGFKPTLAGWTIVGVVGVAIFVAGHAFANDGVQGWGILIAGVGFAFAGAAVLRRAFGGWR